jgi:deferrochelatase/peroxidase EfeB
MIRRGTAYGPLLPEGVLDDDGADRGLMFAFVGAHIGRQFEFLQSQWINDGVFIGADRDKDPVIGSNHDGGDFTVPQASAKAPSRHPELRDHARRRILLHAGTAGPALALRSSNVRVS